MHFHTTSMVNMSIINIDEKTQVITVIVNNDDQIILNHVKYPAKNYTAGDLVIQTSNVTIVKG